MSYEDLSEASKTIVSEYTGRIPSGLTLTQEEADVIMERIRVNVRGAVHGGWKRTSLDGVVLGTK